MRQINEIWVSIKITHFNERCLMRKINATNDAESRAEFALVQGSHFRCPMEDDGKG